MKSGCCTMRQNRRDHGASEMNHHQPHLIQASLHLKKVVMQIWWDWKGVLYYELWKTKQFEQAHCSQLDQGKVALNKQCLELVNRQCIICHQDSARSRFFDDQAKLDWEVLIYPLYSPDIAPSDFHVFVSLQNSLNGKKCQFLGRLLRYLEFTLLKRIKFWEDGIMKLPENWQNMVEQNGD